MFLRVVLNNLLGLCWTKVFHILRHRTISVTILFYLIILVNLHVCALFSKFCSLTIFVGKNLRSMFGFPMQLPFEASFISCISCIKIDKGPTYTTHLAWIENVSQTVGAALKYTSINMINPDRNPFQETSLIQIFIRISLKRSKCKMHAPLGLHDLSWSFSWEDHKLIWKDIHVPVKCWNKQMHVQLIWINWAVPSILKYKCETKWIHFS